MNPFKVNGCLRMPNKFAISLQSLPNPADTGRKLNVHKTFRRRPGRLLNVLYTFNLRPVSTGKFQYCIRMRRNYIGVWFRPKILLIESKFQLKWFYNITNFWFSRCAPLVHSKGCKNI